MTKTRILVVEDEAIVARDLTRQLARLGHEPVADTPRGEDAIELVGQLRPDLVLMDIHLAGRIDGIEADTTIRERHDVPVVFLTAFADDAILERSKRAEPFGYIVKPFDERELHSVIEIGLAKHRAEAELRRSREELATILRTAMDAFWVCDLAGTILDVNDAACTMLGCTRADLRGRTISDFEAQWTPAEVAANLEQIVREGRKRFETRHRRHDGREIDIEVSITVQATGEGRIFAFLREISERKRTEAEQAATAELLRLANTPSSTREFIRAATDVLRNWSGCESVGLRLRTETACPYFENTNGTLVEKDRHLCNCDSAGQIVRNSLGFPLVTCLCDELMQGRFDPAKRCFTPRGSYFNNAVADVLADSVSVPAAHNHRRTRAPDAVAILPLRNASASIGLLQFNNPRHLRFDPPRIAFLERLADHVSLAIAQRQSQAALQTSEQRFRLLLDSTSDYVYSVRQLADGLVQARHGPGCVKVTGYTAADFAARPGLWLEMVPPEDRPLVEEFARRLSRGEQPPALEHRLVHRDGSVRWIRNSVVVHPPTTDGETVHDGVITDITARKCAEEALRASEAKFATVFRCAPMMIAITEIADGTYLDINDEFVRVTGFSRTEIIGRTSRDLGIMPIATRAQIVEDLRQDKRINSLPLAITAKDRRRVDCLFNAEFVDIGGRPRLLSIALDVTEHHRLETQLRQAQKMDAFGQLAGGVAHDFNNILVAITLHVGLLRQSPALDAETAASLRELEQEAARGASLTRQLMTFSRQRPLEIKPLSMNDAVANILRMLRRVLGERIVVEWEPASALPAVDGDVGMIEQVLMNLCVNARDAMPQGGRLTIRTAEVVIDDGATARAPEAPAGRFVRLTVADTGCGIPAEILGRIFEPFFTTKDIGHGTGLGLSIVHGIVQQHHGWIEVASTVGSGTTFQLHFPAAAAPFTAPAEDQNPPSPNGAGELILAVEDEASVREVLQIMLTRHGYRVLTACNGPEALKLWAQHRQEIAALLTDMVLPEGLSGADIVATLRRDRPDLPAIIASGYMAGKDATTPADVEKLPKPFEAHKLLDTLKRLLAPHRARGETRLP